MQLVKWCTVSDDTHVQCIVTMCCLLPCHLDGGWCISDVPSACCGRVQGVMPASVHVNKGLCLPVHTGGQPS